MLEAIQNFISKNLNVDDNTSATIIISLTVFLLGIIIQGILKSYGKFIQRKKNRRIVKQSIKQLIKELKKQSIGFNETEEMLKFDKESHHISYSRVSMSACKTISSIGYEKIYNAFFNGYENIIISDFKIKSFNRFWNIIESITYWHEYTFNNIKSFEVKYSELNEKRNVCLNNLNDYLRPALLANDGKVLDPTYLDYIKQIDKIYSNWQNSINRTRPDIIHQILILPLKEFLSKHQREEISIVTLGFILKSEIAFINQKNFLFGQNRNIKLANNSYRFFYRTMEIIDKTL